MSAQQVINWLENSLDPDEVPPENIWHNAKRLEEHFAAVKQNRENRTSGPKVDDSPEMMDNELTKGLRD